MPSTDPAQRGRDLALVLPRAWLQAQAVQAQPSLQGQQPWLAHGPLVLQSGWRKRLALVGPLRAGPPQPLPARANLEPSTEAPSHDGLCLLMLAPVGAEPPGDGAAWEAWLHAHAPEYRLACPQANPAIAALWLRPDGLVHAVLRQQGCWVAVHWLNINGAHLARVSLPQPAAVTALPPAVKPRLPAPVHEAPEEEDAGRYSPERRDSRLAAALGVIVLTRLQRSSVAVVGAGRIGSILAHGLARLGVARLQVIDCDHMEPHNLDGDMPPHFEGRPKVEALSRYLRPVLRPGATVDARRLPIASPVAGALLADTDLVAVCADNDAARLWANAWALAHHANLLAITAGQHTDPITQQRLAAAELRLLPAGTGCLACLGGFAQADALLTQLQNPLPGPTPADVRDQRAGSLRSWAGIAANLGLRMIEQLAGGQLDRAIFRRLQESPHGGLQVTDSALRPQAPGQACPFCQPLLGAGLAAVKLERVQELARQALRQGPAQIFVP
jgi:hypothetical protein